MRAIVKKWGNSAAVRIPSGILKAARLKLNEAIEVTLLLGRRTNPKIRLRGSCDQRPLWKHGLLG